MSGMPMPEWYGEVKEKMVDILSKPIPEMEEHPDMDVIEDYPHLFAEYMVKANDVLLHIFPRNGMNDRWTDGHYINRCKNCHSEVPTPPTKNSMKPCHKCGHSGLIYIPGRAEELREIGMDITPKIKQAVDTAWMGDAAVEVYPEIGAYVVQFQGAGGAAKAVGLSKFVSQICDTLNALLSPSDC
jgi:hypothetical protein